MSDTHEYQTGNLDLAAFLTAHGRYPSIGHDSKSHLATFTFRRDDELILLLEAFLSGTATASANALLSSRRRLFHEIRQQRRRNHEM